MAEGERAILEKLLTLDLIGREELFQQLSGLQVKDVFVDDEGSIEFHVVNTARSPRDGMVAEARCSDLDTSEKKGVEINVLLHVRDGQLWLLEFYKDDGSAILQRPDAKRLHDLFTPMPKSA